MKCCTHKHQTFAKTCTYFFVHIFIAFLVALTVTGSLTIALSISLVEPLIQMMGYYVHEKVWKRFD